MRTVILAIATTALLASAPARAAAPAARGFATPREAAGALVAAAAAHDVQALRALFGPEGDKLVASGDEVRDHNDRERFAALAREKLDVAPDPRDAHRARVVVGADGWPFPVPLVEKGGVWRFAAKEGLHEVLARRIGGNELDAIEICRGYVEAQHAYAMEDHDGDGVHAYAQKVISTAGKKDGLAWRNADGTVGGPIAEQIANAIAEGYTDRTQPYHGYRFRVLKRQGRSARLGAMDYVIGGHMIGGFALIAWPAEYGVSGVKTFTISHEGVVREKDLGPRTAEVAARIDRYDPDKSWRVVP